MAIAEVYYRGVKRRRDKNHRIGVFFTKYFEEAKFYGPDVSAYRITPQRPLHSETAIDAAEKLGVKDKYLELAAKDVIAADDLISREALNQGYDALIRREGDWIIALKPKVIKQYKSSLSPLSKKIPRITPKRPRLRR